MERVVGLSGQQLADIERGAVYRATSDIGEPIVIGRSDVLAELEESVYVIEEGRRSATLRKSD